MESTKGHHHHQQQHDHVHDHSHNHHHGHHHHHGVPKNFDKAFALGIALNLIFVVIELFYGYLAQSLALMADAGHNFSDVIGLVLAWGAIYLARKKPTAVFTYGYRRTTVLAALANALLLLVALGGIVWEAVHRLNSPVEVKTTTVMVVAGIGFIINLFTAMLFASGSKSDLNLRGAFLHMISDALISLGVVAAGFLVFWSGWNWIDPLTSLIIALVIFMGTWSLLKDSLKLALDAVPAGIHPEKVKDFLSQQKGVSSVHHMHIWGMSTNENALTAHLVMKDGHPGDQFLRHLSDELKHHHNIHHSTIQVELGDEGCGEC